MADRAERARGSFERRKWGDAFDELSAAHREGHLEAEDLERLAVAAYMVGKDDACDEGWIAAHRVWARGGEVAKVAERTAQGRMLPAGVAAFERRDASKEGIYSFEQAEEAQLAPAGQPRTPLLLSREAVA